MEKRRCQRLKIKLPAMIKAIDQDAGLSIATTVDLSGLGFRIATKEDLSLGQEILVQICIEHQNINLKARVMWIEKNNIAPEKESLVGVKILDTSMHDESKFVQFFAKQLLESSKIKGA
jgi:Tfp pilus assembly protein PilZ